MTIKEWNLHKECPKAYIIEYTTRNGKGSMIVKKSFYEKYIKKFTKLFKDAFITSFTEIEYLKGIEIYDNH